MTFLLGTLYLCSSTKLLKLHLLRFIILTAWDLDFRNIFFRNWKSPGDETDRHSNHHCLKLLNKRHFRRFFYWKAFDSFLILSSCELKINSNVRRGTFWKINARNENGKTVGKINLATIEMSVFLCICCSAENFTWEIIYT